jgi:hypothetical protein
VKSVDRILGENDDPYWDSRFGKKMDLANDAVNLTILAKKPGFKITGEDSNRVSNLAHAAINSLVLVRPIVDFLAYVKKSQTYQRMEFSTQVTCIELLIALNQLNARTVTKLIDSIPNFPLSELVAHMTDRIPEIEQLVVRDKLAKKDYLLKFPEVADDWAMNGWIDWLDT